VAEMETTLTGTGDRQFVTGPSRTVEPPAGEHDWVLIVNYRLTGPEAARMSEGLHELLDPSKIAYWSPVMCLRCEHPHSATNQGMRPVVGLPCPGDPDRVRRDGRGEWQVDGNVWTIDPWRHMGAAGG